MAPIYGANHPPIEVLGRAPGTSFWRDLGRHPDDETVPGLMVVRPVAGLYFANAPRLRRRLLDLVDAAAPRPDVLLLDLGAVPDIDISALDLLPAVDEDLRGRGITLWLANINARPLDMLRRLPDAAEWEQRMFREVDDGAAAFAARSRRRPDAASPSAGDERPTNPNDHDRVERGEVPHGGSQLRDQDQGPRQ
jgi:MFS superfamily sulfate permease-like transporter